MINRQAGRSLPFPLPGGPASLLPVLGLLPTSHASRIARASDTSGKVETRSAPVSAEVARGVTEDDLTELRAQFTDPAGFSQLASKRRVVSF